MTPQHTPPRRLRKSLASGLLSVLPVYRHITPPDEEDDSDCTRFIGRCLTELTEEQQRQDKRLQEVERYNGDTPSSSKNDKIDAIWEEIGWLKGSVENIEEKVQDIEEKIQDIDDKLISHDERFDSLEAKVDSLEVKFDKVMFEQDVWASRQRNGLAARLYQPVWPVGISYIDTDGKPVIRVPSWPVKSVGYYWKMHSLENHKRLVDVHRFYQLDFRHWALADDEASDTSYETDDLDPPVATLEQAVSMYPDRAVMALFNELGLVYSRFQEQVAREQLRPTVLQKRSPRDTSSVLERRVKRLSDGSPVDLVPVSTTTTASGSLG